MRNSVTKGCSLTPLFVIIMVVIVYAPLATVDIVFNRINVTACSFLEILHRATRCLKQCIGCTNCCSMFLGLIIQLTNFDEFRAYILAYTVNDVMFIS